MLACTRATTAISGQKADELRRDPAFLLGCMNSVFEPMRLAGVNALAAATGKKIDFDPSADAAARHEKLIQLRRSLLPAANSL